MPRFRFEKLTSFRPGDPIELEYAERNHLFRILRIRKGERVTLIDGSGGFGNAVVEDRNILRLETLETAVFPARKITLYIAPPRRQKFDQILREATELGVFRIVPILCERAVAQPDADTPARRRDLLFEACKQSGNLFLPELSAPVPFSAAIAEAKEHCEIRFFGSPYENENGGGRLPDTVGFFVGPEGGFTEREEDALRGAGALPLRIGPWILRVETAAAAGIARLHAERY